MTPERKEFLTDVLICAIENNGYGRFTVEKYQHSIEEPYAVVYEHEEEPSEEAMHTIDLKVIQRGIGVIRNAVLKELTGNPYDTGTVLHNAKTGKRLYISTEMRKAILDASKENDASQLDVIDCLAIVECGLFGYHAYA